jgi:hypothetical protein
MCKSDHTKKTNLHVIIRGVQSKGIRISAEGVLKKGGKKRRLT